MKKAWGLSYPLSAQQRLWSDKADAQSDPSLRWEHSHFVGFVLSRLRFVIVLQFRACEFEPQPGHITCDDWSCIYFLVLVQSATVERKFQIICMLKVLNYCHCEYFPEEWCLKFKKFLTYIERRHWKWWRNCTTFRFSLYKIKKNAIYKQWQLG